MVSFSVVSLIAIVPESEWRIPTLMVSWACAGNTARPKASPAVVRITATADGERAAYRLFAAGERLTIRARDELSFRLGNAGAFQYSINGTPGRPVGRSGDVREFTISRDNYRDLLQDASR